MIVRSHPMLVGALATLAAVFALVGCSEETPPAQTQQTEHTESTEHAEMDHGEHMDAAPEAPAEMVDVSNATPYPLDVCLVSGEPLGSMGDPYVVVHDGREIKFCCSSCADAFDEEPAKFLAKLEAAAAAQEATP